MNTSNSKQFFKVDPSVVLEKAETAPPIESKLMPIKTKGSILSSSKQNKLVPIGKAEPTVVDQSLPTLGKKTAV